MKFIKLYPYVYDVSVSVVMWSENDSNITHKNEIISLQLGLCIYLIRVIFGKKYDFYVARFANECLWLLCFAAKHSRLSTIRYISFGIAIHNLWRKSISICEMNETVIIMHFGRYIFHFFVTFCCMFECYILRKMSFQIRMSK